MDRISSARFFTVGTSLLFVSIVWAYHTLSHMSSLITVA